MTLPTLPKKDPRTVSMSFRVSKRTAEQLKSLAKDHNMSQADVIDFLIQQEFKTQELKKSKQK